MILVNRADGQIKGAENPDYTRRDPERDHLALPCGKRNTQGIEHLFLIIRPGQEDTEVDDTDPSNWFSLDVLGVQLEPEARVFISPSHGVCPDCEAHIMSN